MNNFNGLGSIRIFWLCFLVSSTNSSILNANTLQDAVMAQNLSLVKPLLNTHLASNREIAKEGGKTPLHLAVENGYIEIVKVLLKDARQLLTDPALYTTNQGESPFELAASNNHLEIVALLAEASPSTLLEQELKVLEKFPQAKSIVDRELKKTDRSAEQLPIIQGYDNPTIEQAQEVINGIAALADDIINRSKNIKISEKYINFFSNSDIKKFKDFKVFGLAEQHTDLDNVKDNLALVNRFSDDGDIYVFEGKEVRTIFSRVKNGDISSLLKIQMLELWNSLARPYNQYEKGQFIGALQNLIDGSPDLKILLDGVAKSVREKTDFKLGRLSYHSWFVKDLVQIIPKNASEEAQLDSVRNKFLASGVKDLNDVYPAKRIFFQAGSLHLPQRELDVFVGVLREASIIASNLLRQQNTDLTPEQTRQYFLSKCGKMEYAGFEYAQQNVEAKKGLIQDISKSAGDSLPTTNQMLECVANSIPLMKSFLNSHIDDRPVLKYWLEFFTNGPTTTEIARITRNVSTAVFLPERLFNNILPILP